jgi:MerR family transcriptional regulator, light-induced transcriptional regulator
MGEYKIKDLETLTGIKAHTIRIWEKRYNLFEPNRTDSNLRVYSDKDVQDILLINLLNRNGYKISKIADLSRTERVSRAEKIKTYDSPETGINKLIYALIEIDELAFDEIIDKLIQEHEIEKTFSNFLVPFLERIGVMWLTDSISVAQEHFISMLIRQRLIIEIDKLASPQESYNKTALLYLPENEWHEIGLLYYHYVIKKNGWRVFYLGQSTPIEGVREICEKKNIDLIVSAWVSNFDTALVQTHYNQVRSFYKGRMAVGGGQACLFEGLDIIKIAKMNDIVEVIG